MVTLTYCVTSKSITCTMVALARKTFLIAYSNSLFVQSTLCSGKTRYTIKLLLLLDLVHTVYFGHTYNLDEICTLCGQRRPLVAALRVINYFIKNFIFLMNIYLYNNATFQYKLNLDLIN